ncbi:MAG: TIGR00341 family protein [Patescibacteria group bacterium]|nr:TIGR00341 family protein [Patescibacteria group bacterium]
MVLVSFNNLSEADKTRAIENLVSQSTPNQDFFFMTFLAVLMATFGILIDNIAVLIGSMLIAPLLSPILSLSLGIIISDGKLISRSFSTILKSMGWSIVGALTVTILFSGGNVPESALSSLQPSFLYMGVAILSGFAATFTLVKPKLNERLTGVAIAVALLPPLALIGVGIAQWSWVIITNAFLLFLLNIIGIVFASMITFSLMNFYVKRRVASESIREEDKKMEAEVREAQSQSEL